MCKPFTHEFRDSYKIAYQYFIDGEWGKARKKFEETIILLKDAEDPLSKNHL